MPLSDFASRKWDERLSNWADWLYGGAGGKSRGVSSIYSPDAWRRGSNRASTTVVLIGPAQDTDRLMSQMRTAYPKLYAALDEWARDIGTRAAQASRLGIHRDTYTDRVDAGKRLLEDATIGGRRIEPKKQGAAGISR